MTIRAFIKSNREEIDLHIKKVLGKEYKLNDEERRVWILNNEDLYNWACSEGVKL